MTSFTGWAFPCKDLRSNVRMLILKNSLSSKKELQQVIETLDDDTVILYEDGVIITNKPTVTRK